MLNNVETRAEVQTEVRAEVRSEVRAEVRSEVQTLLRQGITATKAGQSEQARQALMQAVEIDENNVQAWLWLSAVVDNPTDRLICLENVLALDPGNKYAQAGLARMKQDGAESDSLPAPQPAEPTPSAPQVTETKFPPLSKPARDRRRSSSSKYKRLSPPSSSEQASTAKPAYLVEEDDDPAEPTSAAPEDVFADKYLCPYCATKTRHDDVKCKACGGELWLKVPKLGETSTLFKWVVGLQIFTLIVNPIVTFMLSSALVFFLVSMSSEFESLSFMSIGCASMVFLFHSIMLVGLLQRWRPFFYLLLLSSVLWLGCSGGAIAMSVSLGEIQSVFDLFYPVSRAFLATAQFFMVLNLGDDFTFNKYRILLEVDPGLKTGGDLLERGQRYSERKMWAKAAIHFRQATYKLYENLETHLCLAVAYINLKLYDQAEKPLARARELSSGSFRVEKLQALLDNRRKAESRSF